MKEFSEAEVAEAKFSKAKKDFIDSIAQNKALFSTDSAAIANTIQKMESESAILMSPSQTYRKALDHLLATKAISKSSYKLYKQITPKALVAQCDFFLFSDQNTLFNDLKDKGKIRRKRDVTPVPRTFTLTLENDGSIEMYLETKSKIATMQEMLGGLINKLSDEDKQKLKKSGTSKTGKPCWKLSHFPPEEYFSLVYNTLLGNVTNKLSNQTEAEYVAQFQHPFKAETEDAAKFGNHVDCLEGGTIYVSKHGLIKAVSYSKAAISSLDTFISSTKEGLITSENTQASEKEKYQLIKDILLGVKAMHDQGYVHQDLKPQNILVYETYDPSTGKIVGLQAKISDFGCTTPIINPIRDPKATLPYASPEIFDFQLFHQNQYYSTFYFAYGRQKHRDKIHTDPQYILGEQHGVSDTELQNIANGLFQQFANENKDPAKHNDMWAIGIIAYEILYGQLPNRSSPTYDEKLNVFKDNINNNGFLSGLLEVDKSTRLTVDQALKKVDFRIQVAADTEMLAEARVEAATKAEAERIAQQHQAALPPARKSPPPKKPPPPR